MMLSPIKIAALAVLVTAFGAGAANAQWYSSVQPAQQSPHTASQPYAVEVAPGAYVIHRPSEARAMRRARSAAAAPHAKRSRVKNDPALIEELRQRSAGKGGVINTTKVVYKKPKVVETTRYVDDPPRVVERYTVVDDSAGNKKVVVEAPADASAPGKPDKASKHDKPGKTDKRVIQADAEITILGPDRMTIQLYRKGERGRNARIN